MNDNLIKNWAFNKCDRLMECVNNIDKTKKYTVDFTNSSSFNPLEKYIYDSIVFHCTNKQIDIHNVFTEFSFINKESEIPIQYDESNQENPLFSLLSFFNSVKYPLFFTSINSEEYKYKEFPVDNLVYIAIPKENSQLLYDSSKYNGWLYTNDSECDIEPLFLNINIWNKKPSYDIEIYKPISNENTVKDFVFYENNLVMNKSIINNKIFETLLYNNRNTVKHLL
jgi:hypothetical protein